MKTLLQKEFRLKRTPPVNYSEKDKCHFQEDFEVLIRENHIQEYKNANIVQLYLFHRCSLQSAYCLTRRISFSKKLKAYIKCFIFKKEKINKGLWVLDQWSSGYFHWCTEVLPRIIAAREIVEDYPVLLPSTYHKVDFISESLKALDVSVCYYDINKKVSIKKLLAPSHLQPAQFNPLYINKLKNSFQVNSSSESGSKNIYISRKKAHRRKIVNEDELIQLLSTFGFSTVYMEDLSFFDQRSLMNGAQLLISNHGAGLTNMLFMKEGSSVIELKADADDINNCFFNLASALNHQYYYTINSGDSAEVQKSNIMVDLDKLKTLLNSLF